MRAGRTEAAGTSGQSYIKAQLEAFGWGVVPNPEHDLGTDHWVSPRDVRGFDLRLMLGMQVKNGTSYFSKPDTVDGRAGWWHPDTRAHLDYWIDHNVPHVVVLRNARSGAAYWVHVNKETVQWTGVNGKVFVPADHVLGADALPQLIEVAATTRPRPQWAGSAWTGVADLAPAEHLRYAMLTPRLVAPHPNASRQQLQAHEAIALLTAGRFGELGRYGLADGPEGTGWGWEFYSAILEFAAKQVADGLRACVASAKAPHDLAAASVALASALVELGQVDVALDVINAALDADTCEPVDHAWLELHRARCLVETGRNDEAIGVAVNVQGLPALRPDDVTAAAIAGAGASLVFRASDLFAGDVAATISAGDTEASWWRSQSISWGLGSWFDESFRGWAAKSNEVTFGRDKGTNRLRGVSLVAGFGAMHDAWCYATALVSKLAFMSGDLDVESACDHLTALRRAGDHEAVRVVVERLLLDGPADAVTQAADLVDIDRATHTDIRATFELLQRGADVLSPATADALVSWALRTPEELAVWAERSRPSFMVDQHCTQLVQALVPVVSDDVAQRVRNHVVALSPRPDQGDAHEWARVVSSVPAQSWSADQVAALLARSGDNWELADAIRELAFARDETVRQAITDELRAGSIKSLEYVGPIVNVPTDAIDPLVASLGSAIRERLAQIRGGMFALGGRIDSPRVLALVNVHFPEHADWAPILELLTEPLAPQPFLDGALSTIEWHADKIDDHAKGPLISALDGLLARGPGPALPFFEGDARAAVAGALDSLRPDPIGSAALFVTGTDRRSRQHLIRTIARRGDANDLTALLLLASDPDARIRATTAHAMSSWVVRGIATDGAIAALQRMLADGGTSLARSIVSEWPDVPDERLRPLAEVLVTHRSATVRSEARVVLGDEQHRTVQTGPST